MLLSHRIVLLIPTQVKCSEPLEIHACSLLVHQALISDFRHRVALMQRRRRKIAIDTKPGTLPPTAVYLTAIALAK
jgi:hypothetical protein